MSTDNFWLFLPTFAIFFYVLGWIGQVGYLRGYWVRFSKVPALFFLLALLLHSLLLHRWIDTYQGQNLSILNIFSQVIWLSNVFVWFGSARRLGLLLSIFTQPLAILSIVLVLHFDTEYLVQVGQTPSQLLHVLLSILTLSVLSITAVLAVLIFWQDALLRKAPNLQFLNRLVSLPVLERAFFGSLWLGFLLLTLLLFASFFFLSQVFQPPFLQKSVLVIAAWFVFAALLWGHHYRGWRGCTAARWVLTGFGLLVFSYLLQRFLLGGD